MKTITAVVIYVIYVMSTIVASQDEQEIGNAWIPRWSLNAERALENESPLRSKRAVDLRTLRRLMSNIALSEYYRLRGLEVLGTLGMGHGRPGGYPTSAGSLHLTPTAQAQAQSLSPNTMNMLAAASALSPITALPPSSSPTLGTSDSSSALASLAPVQTQSSASSKQTYFTFPIRANEFQQFFGDMVRRKYSTRRG